MNLVKINDELFTAIDGGISVAEKEITLTIVNKHHTIKSLEDTFAEIGDKIQILDVKGGNAPIATYKGYTHLKSITKNLDDDTYKIVVEERRLEDRIALLEQTIDALMYEDLSKEVEEENVKE